MSMEISLSPESWGEIREQLEDELVWGSENLASALATEDAEVYEYRDLDDLERYENSRKVFWLEFPDDTLVEQCYLLVERNNTCNDDGNGFYLDREGIYQVFLD